MASHRHTVSGKATSYTDVPYANTVDFDAAVKALGARIDKEVAARVVGDTSLADRVTALEGGTAPEPTPVPTPEPTTGTSVRVTTIAALLAALAVNANTEIVVANGTYQVAGAANKAANSLWIGSAFAARTNPVTVRAETIGGVTLTSDGSYFGALIFLEGAHDQTWRGFRFANGKPMESGVIVLGGYPDKTGCHHIILEDITIESVGDPTNPRGHAVYFSQAMGGSHDITIDGLTISDPLGGIKGGLHWYHSTAPATNCSNVIARHVSITGTRQFAIVQWDETALNNLVEDATITNPFAAAVRYELPGSLTLRRVTSNRGGFYSSLGANPAGLTRVDCSIG